MHSNKDPTQPKINKFIKKKKSVLDRLLCISINPSHFMVEETGRWENGRILNSKVCLIPKVLSNKLYCHTLCIYICIVLKYIKLWASLVAQWLGICLPTQGTRVLALVWEDPMCRGATRPVSHNYWACASGACVPQRERPRWWEARAPRWRVAPTCHN